MCLGPQYQDKAGKTVGAKSQKKMESSRMQTRGANGKTTAPLRS